MVKSLSFFPKFYRPVGKTVLAFASMFKDFSGHAHQMLKHEQSGQKHIKSLI